MKCLIFLLVVPIFGGAALSACSDSAGGGASEPIVTLPEAGSDAVFDTGVELKVPVPESGRVHARLDPPGLVPATEAWDLAFEGFDVFTNSGVSGEGKGGAFGPLEALSFLDESASQVPFLNEDKPGGAFIDWYAYDASAHALYSRFHIYGIKDGDRLWKLQVLSYYGKRANGTISAIYKLRYASLTEGGSTREVELDGTAGGSGSNDENASECIDLATGVRFMLSGEAARQSHAWHVCARRDSIFVNGESGGPRGVGAVDLQVAETLGESTSVVMTRTATESLAASRPSARRRSTARPSAATGSSVPSATAGFRTAPRLRSPGSSVTPPARASRSSDFLPSKTPRHRLPARS